MLVALGVARAGRRTDSDERNKGSECADMTDRCEATKVRGEMQRQYGRTPEFDSQLRPGSHSDADDAGPISPTERGGSLLHYGD
jgi:hypothetical protein